MPGRRLRFLRRFGHRASGLAGFAIVTCTYGIGLVLGYEPTFATVLHLPTTEFGWGFVALGLFALTGVTGRDTVQYAVSAAGAAAWALLIATEFNSPYGWTAGVSWAGIAAAMLLSSAWANAPPARKHLDLPTVEELVRPEEGSDVAGRRD